MMIHEQSDGGLEVVTGHFEVICQTNGAPKTSKGFGDATARNVTLTTTTTTAVIVVCDAPQRKMTMTMTTRRMTTEDRGP